MREIPSCLAQTCENRGNAKFPPFVLMAELSSWRFTKLLSQVLGRNFQAFIVIWCRLGRNIRRIDPLDMARPMACGDRASGAIVPRSIFVIETAGEQWFPPPC